MPWLRLWTDILDDVDLHALPRETRWAWTAFLAAAKRHDRDGALPDLKVLAHWVREPREDVSRWIDELVTAGLLDRNGVTVCVHGWQRWQAATDRTGAKRQADWRARQKEARGNAPQPPPHPPEREDKKREREEITPFVTPLRNGEVKTHTPAPDSILSGREGKEHDLFCQVVADLRGFEATKYLADSLVMYADTPEVRGYDSWRLWVACRVVQRPNRGKTWDTFCRAAFNATLEEYERLQRGPAVAMGKAGDRPTNLPPTIPMDIKAAPDHVTKAEYEARRAKSR